MLLSGVRSSCDMFARNSDLYREVSASSAAFSSTARRACSISVFLRSTSAFCAASSRAFCASSSLVFCSSCCWLCCSNASCCVCSSNSSVRIVTSMLLSTMPTMSVQLLEQCDVLRVNLAEARELVHRLHRSFEQHRKDDHGARLDVDQPRRDPQRARRQVREHEPAALVRALPDQALVERVLARIVGARRVGVRATCFSRGPRSVSAIT
jgi:hypothetical protein